MWIEKLDEELFKKFLLAQYESWLIELEEYTMEHSFSHKWEKHPELREQYWNKRDQITKERDKIRDLLRPLSTSTNSLAIQEKTNKDG